MRVAVINCSAPHYNLGLHKLADWLRSQGHAVEWHNGDPGLLACGYDLVCLSVIFSWHAPIARDIALRVRHGSDVWCGGPGMFALSAWWRDETSLPLERGLDQRFERQRGAYKMIFASRGCPVNCSFCVVPRLEGTAFTLDWDFEPAPVLCDNNLSALPDEFQDHIIARYREAGVALLDANSGFEPRTFTEETFHRWRGVLRGPWRFAFDEQREAADVERMMQILAGVRPRMKRVYVLVGNEPITSCYERAMRVIAWGGEPYCQFLKPLNWLGDPAQLRYRHDWDARKALDLCRYFNRFCWRSMPLSAYRSRQDAPPTFASVPL